MFIKRGDPTPVKVIQDEDDLEKVASEGELSPDMVNLLKTKLEIQPAGAPTKITEKN